MKAYSPCDYTDETDTRRCSHPEPASIIAKKTEGTALTRILESFQMEGTKSREQSKQVFGKPPNPAL